MAELVDAADLKSAGSNAMGVRVSPRAPADNIDKKDYLIYTYQGAAKTAQLTIKRSPNGDHPNKNFSAGPSTLAKTLGVFPV